MRVLVLDDDDGFGSAVREALSRDGDAVDWIHSGRELFDAMQIQRYDCLVLSLGLRDMSAELLLRQVRLRDSGVAILAITPNALDVRQRIHLLDAGADDYLAQPVDLHELGARLRAVARRSAEFASLGETIEHGALRLYPGRHEASWKGRSVDLTRREFWLLEILVRHKHEILSRARLEEALYGHDEAVDSNVIEVHVHKLRRKIVPELIVTKRGQGYQLGAEDDLR